MYFCLTNFLGYNVRLLQCFIPMVTFLLTDRHEHKQILYSLLIYYLFIMFLFILDWYQHGFRPISSYITNTRIITKDAPYLCSWLWFFSIKFHHFCSFPSPFYEAYLNRHANQYTTLSCQHCNYEHIPMILLTTYSPFEVNFLLEFIEQTSQATLRSSLFFSLIHLCANLLSCSPCYF